MRANIMAKTESQLQFTFKTKAFQDYYNKNKANPELLGVFEYLQDTDNNEVAYNLFNKFFIMEDYSYSCTSKGASIHTFTISSKRDNVIAPINALDEEEQQLILECLGFWGDTDSIITFSTSIYHYLTIINEG